ncbi:MAG: type VI secretion system baseplate subunit TssK [Gammaproteobacteria bacterium]|nr:type VI secretion system baseplate subunit TssK [Gammaproteobacteria bacterium]
MSWNNKVIWTEGMFLRPQHFQQQERNLQTWIESRCNGLGYFTWGITELVIDEQLLTLGKFAMISCQGIFPDGTPFTIPAHHPAPEPLSIPAETKNQLLYLVLPISRITGREVSSDNNVDQLSRYRLQDIEVRDLHTDAEISNSTIQSGELCTQLRLASDKLDAYVVVPIARVIERKPDKRVILDKGFIPSCLHCSASSQLSSYIEEINGTMNHRGEALAKRLVSPGAGGASEIIDFLLLQIINRYQPLFAHFLSLSKLHPEALFQILIQVTGELSTITTTQHRPEAFPLYDHENLTGSFEPVMISLRRALSWVSESRAIPIPLEKYKHGIETASIHDPELLQSAEFVLAVSAQLPTAKLQANFPRQITIATVDKLRDLVMAQVPGIQLHVLAAAPRQIPYHKGKIYFELEKNHELWKELEKTGSLALHISGNYPGLELELWAIRG